MKVKKADINFINKICLNFDVTPEEIRSRKRFEKLCDIRKIISFYLREKGYTFEKIGQILNRDHSTIMNNVKEYENLYKTDESFKQKVYLTEQIQNNLMKIQVSLNNDRLFVLNNSMQILDKINLLDQPRQLRSGIALCVELRTELLQKAIKSRNKDKDFILKLSYYKADALLSFLKEFEIYFPDNFAKYENNIILIIKNELHQQLQ